MTLQSSGQIEFSDINVELGQSASTAANIGQLPYRILARVESGTISLSNFYGKTWKMTKGIFGWGSSSSGRNGGYKFNLVSNTGTVATDTTAVGTARSHAVGTTFGAAGQAIVSFGNTGSGEISVSNIISNTGACAADIGGVGTPRIFLAAASFGEDKGIFGFGFSTTGGSVTHNTINLVSNTGVIASDTNASAQARSELAAAGYGYDKAIFAFGGYAVNPFTAAAAVSNLVSNTGVVASDVAAVGSGRTLAAAASYGGDKAIFAYGRALSSFPYLNSCNLVSNTGVVASDTGGVGTARYFLAACGFGGDKAIFGYGFGLGDFKNISNLVSNTGVVASDTGGVGTARDRLTGVSFGT